MSAESASLSGGTYRESALARRLSAVTPTMALAGVMAAGVAVLVLEMRGQSLTLDEWSFFADYRGRSLEVLASPFGDNLLLVPIVLYKVVFAAFGPDSFALTALHLTLNLTVAGLFFALMRKRTDDWIAVVATALLILLGAASDIVAATLGIAILLTTACGLGALLALDRGDRAGDVLAAGLLAVALASNSHALPFVAGAAIHVAFDPRRRRRLWIPAVPLAAYGLWRLVASGLDPAGPSAAHPTGSLLTEIGTFPSSLLDSLGAAAVTVSGLFIAPTEPGPFDPVLGPVLGVALLVALWLRLANGPRPGRDAYVFAGMALTYWALIGLVGNDRVPEVPRYQYVGAILLMLTVAELTRHKRVTTSARVAVIAALLISLGTNFAALHEDARFFRERGQVNRAVTAAIEIARDRVDPNLMVEPIGARFDPNSPALFSGGEPDLHTDAFITAGRYLSGTYAFGSPAYSEARLAEAPPLARAYADRELVAALGIGTDPLERRVSLSSGAPGFCRIHIPPPPGQPGALELPAGDGLVVAAPAESEVAVALRRYADVPAARLEPVAAGSAAAIAIPSDLSSRPWRVRLDFNAGVTVCRGAP